MKTEDFAYIVETRKTFDDAVVSVLRSVDQKGWTVFNVYDIQERLAAKGFAQNKLKIIEICSGKYANKFLNKNRLVSLCLPCKINVQEDGGKVMIVGMKPSIISEFFTEITKEEALEAEKEVKEIIESSK